MTRRLRGAIVAAAIAVAAPACTIEVREAEDGASREDRRLEAQLAPAGEVAAREGLAAAILIDVSGSMRDRVRGEGDERERKIDIARRAARELVEQFARYADDNPGEPVLLGIYEFSERDGQPDARPVMPMAPPDRARAEQALASLRPEGGTPIGGAMIVAKRELDATGLSRRHLLVVTDGENTGGYEPHRVAAAIGRRPDVERPSIYFVAFDVAASRFERVKDAGGLVLAAANARELNTTLDTLLRGEILVEK